MDSSFNDWFYKGVDSFLIITSILYGSSDYLFPLESIRIIFFYLITLIIGVDLILSIYYLEGAILSLLIFKPVLYKSSDTALLIISLVDNFILWLLCKWILSESRF